jgi:hypothetical protein
MDDLVGGLGSFGSLGCLRSESELVVVGVAEVACGEVETPTVATWAAVLVEDCDRKFVAN